MRLSRRRNSEYQGNDGEEYRGFGRRGGASPTGGRRARLLEIELRGKVYRKRVFFDQEYLVVSVNADREIVTAHATEDDAVTACGYATREGYEASYAKAVEVKKSKEARA